jgi:hypothetical protein
VQKEGAHIVKRIRLVLAVVAAMAMMAVTAPSAFAAIPIPNEGASGVQAAAENGAPIGVSLECPPSFECSSVLIPPVPGVAGNPGPP